MKKPIFVFGSNLSGIHGAGAAKYAYVHEGAVRGIAFGRTGNSFAIPTKDKDICYTLPLLDIQAYVVLFILYAERNPEMTFKVTRIGCGLAGLEDKDIAPMFINAPFNCEFDSKWIPWIGSRHYYWGTF